MRELVVQRAAERIARIGDDGRTSRELRQALLEEIDRTIGFDAHAWLLTDPETEVGCDPVADVPCMPRLPKLIRLKYATETNRWTSMKASVAGLLDQTAGNPAQSLVWRELLADLHVVDVASLVFRDRFGCWAFLDLWRIHPAGAFTRKEVEYLKAIAPPVTQALRRAQAQTFHGGRPATGPDGPAILILSPDLRVRAQTPETEAYLRALVPASGERRAIPAGAYNVGAQLRAAEDGIDSHPPRARVHLQHGVWLTLRAARIIESGDREPDIAVMLEPTSINDRLALFSLAHGLSKREAELVAACARGADTRRLARELFVSEHTIQDHFKSIFAKTGTRARGELLAIARGG